MKLSITVYLVDIQHSFMIFSKSYSKPLEALVHLYLGKVEVGSLIQILHSHMVQRRIKQIIFYGLNSLKNVMEHILYYNIDLLSYIFYCMQL